MKDENLPYTMLSDFFRCNLCCPICKTALAEIENGLYCDVCLSLFPKRNGIYDFRGGFQNPHSGNSTVRRWRSIQNRVENVYGSLSYDFAKEIEGVLEIYTDVFHLEGCILDVGGHQGRLRHFLRDRSKYVCIDPFIDVFERIDSTAGLTDAYPCLLEPCNFVAGFGEHLPFRSELFEWAHLRSVLDHFYDPYWVVKECVRVLRKGGRFLIGTSVIGGCSSISESRLNVVDRLRRRFRLGGVYGLMKAALGRIEAITTRMDTSHMKEWKYGEVIELIENNGLKIEKIHWQKPPEDYCVYISAAKVS